MLTVLCKSYAVENNKEQINHQKPEKINKLQKNQRSLNIEEHCKIENNHYQDHESQKPKYINPTNPHKQKKLKINNKKTKHILISIRPTQYDMLPQHQVIIRKLISECF